MECTKCGRTVTSDLNFCPYCGNQFREPPYQPPGHALGPPSKQAGTRSEGTTLVLVIAIVIVVVVLPIVLSAILYFMVLGFGGSDSETPTAALTTSPTAHGYSFVLASVSQSANWDDLLLIFDGTVWTPERGALDSGVTSVDHLPSVLVGQLMVWCNVTDVSGNGVANSGDYFTLETTSSPSFAGTGTHIVKIVYQPTSGDMCTSTFTA